MRHAQRSFIGLIAALALTAGAAAAQQPTLEPPFTTKGAFFALSVADIAASARWYREKLGLRVVMEAPPRDGSSATVLEGGGLLVELIHRADARPLREAAPGVTATYGIHGIFKVGVVIDDFDRTLAALRARGVEIALGPFPARADQPANVIVKDNEGNYIQFFGRK